MKPCTVAVRTLCEFTAREGDLDRRFTPSATALEGQAGQAAVMARRAASYRSEVALSGEFGGLVVRGRADGYDPEGQRLEEVKTFRGDLTRMTANRRALHWAQVRVYGALFCRQEQMAAITLALVYVDAATHCETVLTEAHAAADLQAFFESQCRRYQAWAWQEAGHAGRRDNTLAALAFPHTGFRAGQRPLAEAVYRAAISGRPLLAQAPTGIGKTVGTLFPLLKAWGRQRLDKVFFLTAKTPGRDVALQSLAAIVAATDAGAAGAGAAPSPPLPPPLRVLEMVARDKACEHPGKACHGDACPLAAGFYDRLPAARAEAVAGAMDKPRLRQVASAHRVCPYYLGQEMVRWADVIVADYNHYFDTRALLHGMTVANDWRVGLLVDEAHNLVPRARSMYSAALRSGQLQAVRPLAPAAVAPALARLAACWSDLERQSQPPAGGDGAAPGLAPYTPLAEPPERWLAALQGVNAAFAEHLASDPPELPPTVLRFYFDALHFSRLCDAFGAHSIVDLTPGGEAGSEAPGGDGGPNSEQRPHPRPMVSRSASASTLSLRNLVPAAFLAPRFAAAKAVVLFSATLAPKRFHADLLGLPADGCDWVDTPSPFASGQLQVRIAGHISTRIDRRQASLEPIVELMAGQYAQAPGNYLAFFSSFDYLVRVVALFRQRHPATPVWEQSRAMSEADRAGFLARFTVDGRGIGFAVLGGAFAEGIDLAGARLIGAFIATLGLPQVNAVNERFRERIESMFGKGHDYAYLYPGLQRVVQAAGRVIRTPQDVGTVHLIDARFERPDVRALLPAWWALPARHGRTSGAGHRKTGANGLPVLAIEVDETVNNEA